MSPSFETLTWLRHTAAGGQVSSQLTLEVLDRLGALEIAVAQLPRLEQRLNRLEAAPPAPEPIDEAENDRRFRACMKAIDEATPEQIRAATGSPQPPAGLSLIDEIADAFCGRYYDPAGVARWRPEARRAAAVIVRRLRELDANSCCGFVANWLEQEAAQ